MVAEAGGHHKQQASRALDEGVGWQTLYRTPSTSKPKREQGISVSAQGTQDRAWQSGVGNGYYLRTCVGICISLLGYSNNNIRHEQNALHKRFEEVIKQQNDIINSLQNIAFKNLDSASNKKAIELRNIKKPRKHN